MRSDKHWVTAIAAAGWIVWGVISAPLHAQSATDSRPVILAVGESTTAGYGVPRDQNYPAQLQQLLDANGYDYRVVNHGKSGSTVAMALGSLDRGLLLQPEIVLIAIGGNDAGNSVAAERTEQNLRKLVSMFVRTGATVYLADRTAATDGGQPEQVSLYAAIASEEGAILMPSLRQDIAGQAQLLISDMRHPNADGYAIIAQRIFALLQPQLVK
jgi:acyl-CoA thioesterase-1